MSNQVEDLADRIFLAIEIECDECKGGFSEPEGDSETEIRQWAEKTAAFANGAGWRMRGEKISCAACWKSGAEPDASPEPPHRASGSEAHD